jgi:hypothetical protein
MGEAGQIRRSVASMSMGVSTHRVLGGAALLVLLGSCTMASGSHLELDGQTLQLASSCVMYVTTPPCVSPSHPTNRHEVVCNVLGNGDQRQIQVWLDPPEAFVIYPTSVTWLRGRYGYKEVDVKGGVTNFDAKKGADVDVMLDGHHLAGSVRC